MKKTKDKVAEIQVSYHPSLCKKPVIITAFDAFIELIEFFPVDTISLNERFVVMYLNRSNRVLGVYELSKGGITGTVVDIRLLLSVAVKTASTSIIVCHNHPSGNLKPSSNDIQITQKIKEACQLLDIKLVDHIIIVAARQYLSMAEEGIV